MAKAYFRPIVIQKVDTSTEKYTDWKTVHASINKAQDDNEYLRGGAIQAKRKLVFEVRYFSELEEVALNTQYFRIVYDGVTYDVTSYDDYNLEHKTVKLLGESVG